MAVGAYTPLDDLEELFFQLHDHAVTGCRRMSYEEIRRARWEAQRLFGEVRGRLDEQEDRIHRLAEQIVGEVIP